MAFWLLQGSLTTPLVVGLYRGAWAVQGGWVQAGGTQEGEWWRRSAALLGNLCGDCGLQAGLMEGGVGASLVNGRLHAGRFFTI